MIKNKRGFTLGEVVVTIGIIGVVAALTIPQIAKYNSSITNGAAVSRGVQAIETGLANVFAIAQKRTSDNNAGLTNSISALKVKDILDETSDKETYLTKGTQLFGLTRGIMGTKDISSKSTYLTSIRNYNDNNAALDNSQRTNALALCFGKNKFIVITLPIDDAQITTYLSKNTSYTDLPSDAVIEKIYIDANGTDNPNRLGQDVFLFGLTDSGKMVPAGSQAYNNNIFNETIPLYTTACNKTTVTDARACSARLVHDNWKIKYNK